MQVLGKVLPKNLPSARKFPTSKITDHPSELVLRRRNTVVRGKCALPSTVLVIIVVDFDQFSLYSTSTSLFSDDHI